MNILNRSEEELELDQKIIKRILLTRHAVISDWNYFSIYRPFSLLIEIDKNKFPDDGYFYDDAIHTFKIAKEYNLFSDQINYKNNK